MAYESQKQIARHGDAESAAELGKLLCDGWMISSVTIGAGDSLYDLRREIPEPPKPREWRVRECGQGDGHGAVHLTAGLPPVRIRIVEEVV